MNEKILIDCLKAEDSELWNSQKIRFPDMKTYVTSQSLFALRIKDFDLSDVIFRGTQFVNCAFDNIIISNTDFSSCIFDSVRIIGGHGKVPDFRRSRFKNCTIEGWEITGPLFNGTSFSQLSIHDSRLFRGAWHFCTFTQCQFYDSNFRYSDFRHTSFRRTKFSTCDLCGTLFSPKTLHLPSFSNCDLGGSEGINTLFPSSIDPSTKQMEIPFTPHDP